MSATPNVGDVIRTYMKLRDQKAAIEGEVKERVSDLRRRIEVQNDLMAALAKDVQKLQNEVEKLSLDLGIRQGEAPGWAEVRP
jgi:hypothetical protein